MVSTRVVRLRVVRLRMVRPRMVILKVISLRMLRLRMVRRRREQEPPGVYINKTGYGGSFNLGEIASVSQSELFTALMGVQEGFPIGTQGEDVLMF